MGSRKPSICCLFEQHFHITFSHRCNLSVYIMVAQIKILISFFFRREVLIYFLRVEQFSSDHPLLVTITFKKSNNVWVDINLVSFFWKNFFILQMSLSLSMCSIFHFGWYGMTARSQVIISGHYHFPPSPLHPLSILSPFWWWHRRAHHLGYWPSSPPFISPGLPDLPLKFNGITFLSGSYPTAIWSDFSHLNFLLVPLWYFDKC